MILEHKANGAEHILDVIFLWFSADHPLRRYKREFVLKPTIPKIIKTFEKNWAKKKTIMKRGKLHWISGPDRCSCPSNPFEFLSEKKHLSDNPCLADQASAGWLTVVIFLKVYFWGETSTCWQFLLLQRLTDCDIIVGPVEYFVLTCNI